MARRLGWLGPTIVIVGAAIACAGLYLMLTGRPEPGEVIDRLAIDEARALVVRAEQGGDRNFVELVEGDRLVWRALVPRYAGRPGAPGIAWGQGAVTIRVIRGDRAEVFAVAMTNANKLGGFKLAPGKGPVVKQTRGPVTLTDHERSYEIVAGQGWGEVVGIDLASGEALWKQDLGAVPVDAATISDGAIWIEQGGTRRGFGLRDGSEVSPNSA
jgi:outer membrane protein assembly factor BamB